MSTLAKLAGLVALVGGLAAVCVRSTSQGYPRTASAPSAAAPAPPPPADAGVGKAQLEHARLAIAGARRRVATAAAVAAPGAAPGPNVTAAEHTVITALAEEVSQVGAEPLRGEIQAGILRSFLDEHDGLRLSLAVLAHPGETIATFGEDQAAVRHLCLAALDLAGKDHLADVVTTMQAVGAYLAATPTWAKGVEYDYRDLLYTYLDNVGFDAIEADPARFLQDIGHGQRLGALARRYTLQYFDSRVSDERLYPLLRKLGGLS